MLPHRFRFPFTQLLHLAKSTYSSDNKVSVQSDMAGSQKTSLYPALIWSKAAKENKVSSLTQAAYILLL